MVTMPLLSCRVDLDAIAHNVRALKAHIGPQHRFMGVVKADAYGHGVERVAPVLVSAGVDALGVATLKEAIQLRDIGIEVPILAWLWDAAIGKEWVSSALAAQVELAIPSLAHAQLLVDSKIPGKVCVKVETGMHRNGVDMHEWNEVFALLASEEASHLQFTGVMSHLACADDPDNPHNAHQIAQLQTAIEAAKANGLEPTINHLAASAAAIDNPKARFEQVRVGVALYGLSPFAHEVDVDLKPASTWAAKVVNVKPIEAGDAASYRLTWTAESSGHLAVIPVGYADGLPRMVQGHLEVGIGGKRYPQVGRVCMDQIVVDLGENPFEVVPGDEAIIFGVGGMSATELADAVGTINYEVVCWPKGRTRWEYEGGYEEYFS